MFLSCHCKSDLLFIAHFSVKLPATSVHNTRYKTLDISTQEVRGAKSLDIQVHKPWAYMFSMGAMNIHWNVKYYFTISEYKLNYNAHLNISTRNLCSTNAALFLFNSRSWELKKGMQNRKILYKNLTNGKSGLLENGRYMYNISN